MLSRMKPSIVGCDSRTDTCFRHLPEISISWYNNRMNTTSASLLLRLQASSESGPAWNRFVDLYTPLIYYWARKNGLQSVDASDLVQEVLAVLVKKIADFQYDPRRSFRGWLRTITLNKLREQYRRKKNLYRRRE